ncbi:hypothetical protein DFP91_5067 [Pseudorhodoplanes sinuspersici]|nr:hypothetical protein DFP91_5067 [Pseudorhodoplanes sinuspersici]
MPEGRCAGEAARAKSEKVPVKPAFCHPVSHENIPITGAVMLVDVSLLGQGRDAETIVALMVVS